MIDYTLEWLASSGIAEVRFQHYSSLPDYGGCCLRALKGNICMLHVLT